MVLSKVYKEGPVIHFTFTDNRSVEYDIAQKIYYGLSGKPVNDLRKPFANISVEDMIKACTCPEYGKFLSWIKNREEKICNIGTILERIPRYSHFEQFFSAGITNISRKFNKTIDQVPHQLIKLCRTTGITLSDYLLDYYQDFPNEYYDVYMKAYNEGYRYLTVNTIQTIMDYNYPEKVFQGNYTRTYVYHSKVNKLIKNYNYDVKSLFEYFDYLMTYEAFTYTNFVNELVDYADMSAKISPNKKFDKYPKNLLLTHMIVTRNYDRLHRTFDEEEYKKHIKKDMECTIGKYVFIYPKSTQDFKDEAVMQNNCIVAYIEKVLQDKCDIIFMRKKDFPNSSLVTCEVVNGKIVTALQRFNTPITPEQSQIIYKWNIRYANKHPKEVTP